MAKTFDDILKKVVKILRQFRISFLFRSMKSSENSSFPSHSRLNFCFVCELQFTYKNGNCKRFSLEENGKMKMFYVNQ